ncbi:MAG: hypothetical protein KC925_03930 [Candidatus Doudnabacteria bacterium]|nr:hypothetical protein [Candidatus Doudnabacteria bacterium]
MAQDVKAALKSGSVPSEWTVLKPRKAKSAWKGFSDLIWGVVFVALGLGLPAFVGDEMPAAVRWGVLVVGVLIGLFLVYSGIRKLFRGAVGAIVVTESELVIIEGSEKHYPLQDYASVRLLSSSNHGQMNHLELELEHQDGRRMLIAESDTYGNDLEGLLRVIETKLGGPRDRADRTMDQGIPTGTNA